jgi:hypothetical protein
LAVSPSIEKPQTLGAKLSQGVEMQISFQTALITGGRRGLRRQIAVKLATEGVNKIAIHYWTGKSDMETTLSLIEAAGASGVLVQGDVAEALAAEKSVKQAQKTWRLRHLCSERSASVGRNLYHVVATELSLEKWQLAFDPQHSLAPSQDCNLQSRGVKPTGDLGSEGESSRAGLRSRGCVAHLTARSGGSFDFLDSEL